MLKWPHDTIKWVLPSSTVVPIIADGRVVFGNSVVLLCGILASLLCFCCCLPTCLSSLELSSWVWAYIKCVMDFPGKGEGDVSSFSSLVVLCLCFTHLNLCWSLTGSIFNHNLKLETESRTIKQFTFSLTSKVTFSHCFHFGTQTPLFFFFFCLGQVFLPPSLKNCKETSLVIFFKKN